MTSGDHPKQIVTTGTDKDKEKEKDKDKDMIEGSAILTCTDYMILSGRLPTIGDVDMTRTIICLFFDLYQTYTGIEHPRIVSVSDFVEKVINRIFWVEDEHGNNVIEYLIDEPEELFGFYKFAIIRYLDRFSKSGICNIFHFFSGNIRLMRHYDYMRGW